MWFLLLTVESPQELNQWTLNHCSQGETQGEVPGSLWPQHFTHHHHSLGLCMLLFRDILFNIYYWFINVEFMANSSITHAWMNLAWHNTYLFSRRHITAFLCSGVWLSTSALHLGTILNSETTNHNPQNANSVTQKWLWKDTCLESENWDKKQTVTLLDLSWEHVCWATWIFYLPAHVHRWPPKRCKYWF